MAATAITLRVEPASAEALAPFGHIVGAAAGATPHPVDFYRGAVQISYPAPFACEHPVELALAAVDPRPFEVRYVERHFQHTQVFLPLGGKHFVAVMAPPGPGELPDLAAARAFRFDGTTGFAMHLGTWHEFPFALEPGTKIVVLLSSQTGYDLRAKNPLTEEAFGPDLDKKDIVARTGKMLRFEMVE
jgi:ureidoglycolate lyase